MSNDYSILQPYVNKIKKKESEYGNALSTYHNIQRKKDEFETIVPRPHSKFTIMAIICIAALLFDYFISIQTMEFISFIIGVPIIIIAFIFSLIDGGISVLASGMFSKSLADRDRSKMIWRPVLWALALTKIVLFIVFQEIVNTSTNERDWLLTVLMVIFIIIIYAILDRAGMGLFLGIKKASFWIQEEILNTRPDTLLLQIKETYTNFNKKAVDYGWHSDLKNIYDYYGLEKTHILPNNN